MKNWAMLIGFLEISNVGNGIELLEIMETFFVKEKVSKTWLSR